MKQYTSLWPIRDRETSAARRESFGGQDETHNPYSKGFRTSTRIYELRMLVPVAYQSLMATEIDMV